MDERAPRESLTQPIASSRSRATFSPRATTRERQAQSGVDALLRIERLADGSATAVYESRRLRFPSFRVALFFTGLGPGDLQMITHDEREAIG